MKQTFQLIAIFVLTLVIFVSYSKAPDYVADAIHLKQIGQQDEADAEMEEEEAAADNVVAEPVDTARQRILIFGDSMSQLLALRFSDYANQNGHSLTCVTWNGSSTRQWATSDTLLHYMRSVRPTHVFVCLGSNELYTADMKNCRKRAEAILAKIGNVPTTWVGPPNWMEDKGINTMLQKLMGHSRYFMTKGMKLDRQKDGRHPTRAAAVVWVDKIVEWMKSGKAAHPFRLDKPLKRSTKYRQVVIPMNPSRHRADNGVPTEGNIEGMPAEQTAEQKAENAADRVPSATVQHDASAAPAATPQHEKTATDNRPAKTDASRKTEGSVRKSDTPVRKSDAPAHKADTPAHKGEAPAE